MLLKYQQLSYILASLFSQQISQSNTSLLSITLMTNHSNYLTMIIIPFLLILTYSTSLLQDVTNKCISKLHLDTATVIKHSIQFWQTWSEMEFVSNVLASQQISQATKNKASKLATQDWTKFDPQKSKVPCYRKLMSQFDNHDYWNPDNLVIIWDDRLWLGNSYLELYKSFKVQKYLEVAIKLYQFIIKHNADPRSNQYRGLEWKPKTDYRNSVTNELFFIFCTRLYQITHNPEYLEMAQIQFQFLFLQAGKFINSNPYNIFSDSGSPGGYYSYNQGLAIQGLGFLVKYGTNKDEAMHQLSRLINGMIDFFHIPSQNKLIMIEHDTNRSICNSIFRGVVFKHLIKMREKLSDSEWGFLLCMSPKLKLFILDNAQAISRYQSVQPAWNWTQYKDIKPDYYNVFNQFFILNSAEKLFGIKQVVIPGVQFVCNQTFKLVLAPNIVNVKLIFLNQTSTGVYQSGKSYSLHEGGNNLKYLLPQNICSPTNNRNIFTLEWEYKDNSKSFFTLVHVEGQHSKFGLIPDKRGQQVINNNYVRIQSDCKEGSKVYQSENGRGKIKLSASQSCGKKEALLTFEIE